MLDIEDRGRYEVEGCPSDERCLWAVTNSLPAYLMLQTRAGWVALRFIEDNLLAAEAMASRQRFVGLFILYAALLRGNGEQLVRSMRVPAGLSSRFPYLSPNLVYSVADYLPPDRASV